MKTYIEAKGNTPHGGVKCRTDFYDKDGNPCVYSESDHAVFREYDANGNVIYEGVLRSTEKSIL